MPVNNNFVQSKIPNFPTPPVKALNFLSMPNDLVANRRNYYTEIKFVDYRAAAGISSVPLLGGLLSSLGNLGAGTGLNFPGAAGGVRLPIPMKINDITTLNWKEESGTKLIGNLIPSRINPALSQVITSGGGALLGKAINPLLFMAFNHQNFKEYTFEWVLAPRTRQESLTVTTIINLFKNSSLPAKNTPFLLDYPLIAIVRMSPNNLNGLAQFKPMAVEAVAANYTPNPVPSFFENTGAPTAVTLSVKMKEIKLWYRGEYGIF